MDKPVVYIDLDNTLVDFPSAFPRVDPALLVEFAGDEDDIPGIFALMDPMPGAIEAFEQLALDFDVYILSTAPWKNPTAWHDKVVWVQQHLGAVEGTPAYKRLILSHHKNLNHGQFLIDDRPTKNGADAVVGEVLHFGSEAFPDWGSVLSHLRDWRERG